MAAAIIAAGRALMLVSVVFAPTLYAQTPAQQTFQTMPSPAAQPAPSLLQQPPHDAQIDLSADTLTIRADNSSLTAILHQIATKSGMQIDGLGADERVFGTFGPGPPRDVLADLLNGTAYNLVLLGDLSDGVPRQLILTPTTRAGAAPTPAPAKQASADEAANEQETVETPPPPQPEPQQPPPPGAPGVRTPQQLFEQLQRMRSQQQQNNPNQDQTQQQQQTTPPAQQP